MKTYLEARSVYLHNRESIYGHFTICYLALTVLILLELKVFKDELPIGQIVDFITTLKANPISNDQFLLSGSYQDVIKIIEKRYGLNFNSKTISLDKLKNYFLSNYYSSRFPSFISLDITFLF